MRGLSEFEFANTLKDCCLSIWMDDESGFGTFPLESMKCGVPVVGKIPSTEPDWLSENGMWTYDENKIVDVLGTFVLAWLDGVELTNEVKQKMKETLLPYETEITKNNILSIFNSFTNKRIETFTKALENLKQEQE
jgi:glycosyltransferase involved in cell wall biosynthesis